jgi:hypothetical protein
LRWVGFRRLPGRSLLLLLRPHDKRSPGRVGEGVEREGGRKNGWKERMGVWNIRHLRETGEVWEKGDGDKRGWMVLVTSRILEEQKLPPQWRDRSSEHFSICFSGSSRQQWIVSPTNFLNPSELRKDRSRFEREDDCRERRSGFW